VAIADPRTYSVIVTAAKDDMPGIAEIISQLDSNAARKQKVYVYTLENADVRKVENVLKNLFQSSNARSSTSTDPDPLGNSRVQQHPGDQLQHHAGHLLPRRWPLSRNLNLILS
jgi:type II secretory pathway component GspD/PulD (secretin)